LADAALSDPNIMPQPETSPSGMQRFEALVAGLDYPMMVVTTASQAERAGCLVGFTSQCSIDPPRFAVFLSRRNRTAEVAAAATSIVLHLLGVGDKPLARLFGEETGDEIDKFDRCTWHPGPDNVPVIDGCPWILGRITERLSVGDHILHLVDIVDSGGPSEHKAQLGFQALRDLEAGRDP
jgi:flavin reductase (DIM6/NTAB) family NADH-FMN oxidoreductase RutF